MKISLICPVRNRTDEEDAQIKKYVRTLIGQGHEVREPKQATNQIDEIGLTIVEDHELNDRLWAQEEHIWWNPKSSGSWWDVFQVYAACRFLDGKKIVWVNEEPDLSNYIKLVEIAAMHNPCIIYWKPDINVSFLTMAYARMVKYFDSDKIIYLSNLAMLKLTEIKSYTNVAIATSLQLTAKDVKMLQDLSDVMGKYGL